ncbi:purine-cytosine permease family protein [Tengunoibacter tsumagoiensis]|uniref:Cytosine permease n=1 Tax=Tengunoibacter tsumagoiensis TaxID=2014871 RepID=A0A402AAP4_9CHLR|nr:cytosine permease [Tengunoibacter tsumagoiensis]GCE16001.1 cytosine permease [Tengunoibacter tsumagoiensis]
MQNDLPSLVGSQEDASTEFLKVERIGLEAVPLTARKGSPRELALVWSGAMSNYISLFTGALVIGAPAALVVGQGQLGLVDCCIAIIIGASLAAILHGLLNVTGARTGMPQMLFARAVFGHRGAYLGAAFTWIMAVGWFAVDCVIGGWALVQLLSLFGVPKTTEVAMGSITLILFLSIVVAVYGHRTVFLFEKFGALLFIAFCLLLFVILLPQIRWNLPTTVHGFPRIAAIVLGASYIYALVASWLPFAGDYSRYQPANVSSARLAGWSALGIGGTTIILGISGVLFSTIHTQNIDLLSAITMATPQWLTIPFLLFVVLGEIWANYFDVYTAGLVALAMDIPLKRWWSALACGIIGALCVYSIGFFSHFTQAQTYTELTTSFLGFYEDFLLLTYLWVPAWAAVLLVHFFLLHQGSYDVEGLTRGAAGPYWFRSGIFWPALCSWLIGFVVTIPFISSAPFPWLAQPWQGPLAHMLGGMDVSGIVGALVSGGLYYYLGRTRFRQQSVQETL